MSTNKAKALKEGPLTEQQIAAKAREAWKDIFYGAGQAKPDFTKKKQQNMNAISTQRYPKESVVLSNGEEAVVEVDPVKGPVVETTEGRRSMLDIGQSPWRVEGIPKFWPGMTKTERTVLLGMAAKQNRTAKENNFEIYIEDPFLNEIWRAFDSKWSVPPNDELKKEHMMYQTRTWGRPLGENNEDFGEPIAIQKKGKKEAIIKDNDDDDSEEEYDVSTEHYFNSVR